MKPSTDTMSGVDDLVQSFPAHGGEWDAIQTLRGMTILTRLASKNRLDLVVKLLRRYRADKCSVDVYGNSCLHYFALRNNGFAYEELLSYGLNEHTPNKANQTPAEVRDSGTLLFATVIDETVARVSRC
jgi:ankyrin repeat protein